MLAETGGPLEYEIGGWVHEIPAAVLVPDEDLLDALRDPITFARFAEVPEGVAIGQVEDLRHHYCEISGLPVEPGAADTLRAILNRFGSHIEADFARTYPGEEPGALWRARRWRRLDNLIFRLPRASLYREAMLNDPELVASMLERQRQDEGGATKGGLPISEYTPEVALLRDLINEERKTRAVLIGVNSKHGKIPKVDPYPGPITAIEETEFRLRKERHEALTKRVLRRG